MSKAIDKFWLFASRAHDDDIHLGKSNEGRFSPWSRITPAEGAYMLGTPNMIMVNSDGIPVPFSKDALGYAESFCRMDSVLWSVTGSGGFRIGNEEAFICELAEKYPNIKGAFMDDFFGLYLGKPNAAEEMLAVLKKIRSGLDKACRPMELWVTWYTRELTSVDPRLFDYIDGITLWTWSHKELELVRERYESIEARFPRQKKLLGIYILDYPSGEPVPDDMMRLQCEFGLEMMKQKRMDGLVFLTNCVMGVGLSSEYWLRNWIDEVKNVEIPD